MSGGLTAFSCSSLATARHFRERTVTEFANVHVWREKIDRRHMYIAEDEIKGRRRKKRKKEEGLR